MMFSCTRMLGRQMISPALLRQGSVPSAMQFPRSFHTSDNKLSSVSEQTSEGALSVAIKGMRVIPTRMQSSSELVMEFVKDLCKQNIGEEGYRYFPYALGLFSTLGVCNVANLLPYVEAPTQIIGCTVAMSTTIILGITIKCIQKHKLDFGAMFFPLGAPLALAPLLVPIETISFFSRALSLGVRLGANLTAGHMIMHILADFSAQMIAAGTPLAMFPLAILVPVTLLEIAVAVIQAYVFTMLTTMYMKDAIELH